MGSDQRKRQKKLERKTAKRKEKRHQLVRVKNAGLGERLTAASKFPVLDCWITEALWEQGLGWVVLSRALTDGTVTVAVFLVDRYCLGVKNVHAEILGRASYDEKYARRMNSEMPARRVSPADALKLIKASVGYARGLGLAPHPDYLKILPIFGNTNPEESTAHFEFGKDGKPYFISGPNDTPQRIKRIITTLTNTCGPGNFDFLAGIDPRASGAMMLDDNFMADTEEFEDDEDE